MVKLRQYIEDKKLTGRAFVSIRIMESMRDTYIVYRTYQDRILGASGNSLITSPKTLQQACESFFSLFPENVVREMKTATDYDGFKKVVGEKNMMPVNDPKNMNFDSPQEEQVALDMAKTNDEKKNKIYQTN